MIEFIDNGHLNVKKVLVLGSGAIKIGEAGEFDFSGSQALKALKEEGIETVLVNPNIATIQTDPKMASKIYLLPVTADVVLRIIEKERPDSILLNVGGQTALNCGMELVKRGILEKYGIRVLGTQPDTIQTTEDRELFKQAMDAANIDVCRSTAVTTVTEAIDVAENIGYPVIVRAAFTLGGLGSGVAKTKEELEEIASVGLSASAIGQILVEESVSGWKELEYEVMRDVHDNCIIICNMENLDPVGVHTGESIVVAPSQTLNNKEYHALRDISLKAIRFLGVVGECNIQFALNPDTFEYRVIEVNPRLSRSSALASKATGYPIAFVATKLCLGANLSELKNQVTGVTTACFEPALDYVVVKFPRWDLKKFKNVDNRIGTQMKSVGEVMAIGRKFEEALQKAVRMVDESYSGVVGNNEEALVGIDDILLNPTDERLFYVAAAYKRGYTTDKIHNLSKIDNWFLEKIKNIIDIEKEIKQDDGFCIEKAKKHGFSDAQIANISGKTEDEIRLLRKSKGIVPFVKRIDTLAAEWPAKTNYLYLTYNGAVDDVDFERNNKVIVLGSGTYRIGSSVEFDWCSVHGIWGAKSNNKTTIMINHNPETVSTDYDIPDKLYFEDLNLETVLDICEKENPMGVIVSFGGQRPNNIALQLHDRGVNVLGTHPKDIDRAEDRAKFSALLDTLGIGQPVWCDAASITKAKEFARKCGYPVIVRPSYVLSGAAMNIVHSESELEQYIKDATTVSKKHPVVVSKFMSGAREVEVDGVCDGKNVLIGAIAEHIENAGVHSGDATIVIPTQTISKKALATIDDATKRIATNLHIKGPFNIQYLVLGDGVYVIECNLRASRSMPFVSKVVGINLIEVATNVILGQNLLCTVTPKINHIGIKVPQFSFMRLYGADPVLGIEMASTGEVACMGKDFSETLITAMRSAGIDIPLGGARIAISLPNEIRGKVLEDLRVLSSIGFSFLATPGTAAFMKENGLSVQEVHKARVKEKNNILDCIVNKKIDIVVNIPHANEPKEEMEDGYLLRRATVNYNIPLLSNLELFFALVLAIKKEHERSFVVELSKFAS
ncbi:MAG: carbamoyl-phosphate synthase (glutamine-hydrolyzing) large subunit [Candidatus Aenigmarchaeota archaeon]|nr:carbamoyl-phosphate synthase (glutamine-hydrolyzing) large subunit [Candidatus Aenigmarchaeota archaeon]